MQTRHHQTQILQHHVLGLVSIICLLFLSFPVAYWRVSRSEKFAGLPMKSLQLEDSQKPKSSEQKIPEDIKQEGQAVSIQPTASIQTVNQQLMDKTQLLSPEQREALKGIVYEKIDRNWKNYPNFAQSLLYHVDVNQKGEIIAYNPLTQTAKIDVNEVPLSQLVPSDIQPQNTTSYSQFTVIFHTNGVLEVHH